MKILLSWLLDHLDATIADINVEKLVDLFNTRTAEIESFSKITFDHSAYFMLKVVKSDNQIETFCPELNEKISMPKRSDASAKKYFIAIRNNKIWRWATLQDFSTEKEGLMPAIWVSEAEAKGPWKKSIPKIDYILEIDNKSINHRPDLWGHYGIAREVASFLNIKLKPLNSVIKKTELVSSSKNLSIKLQAKDHCYRIAGIVCNDVTQQDSAAWMAIRLAQVDSKPMNLFVDLTNYVMFDIGHPMHVFDAAAFPDHEMILRMAHKNEKLNLLDGENVTLETTDLVIANKNDAVSLPGVIGGKNSGFNSNTKNIILEAAGVDPLTIRKTAQRLKIRTESSMRFEKHLDPMQNVTAIQRFLFLAEKLKLLAKTNGSIVSVGQIIQPLSCKLSHEFVENKIGATIKPDLIKKTLSKLGFGVSYHTKSKSYTIIVPTNRMTKDIKIQEDLVEEIIRSYGFENIKIQLPMREMKPCSTHVVQNIDHIKRHLAFRLDMHEVSDYLLYDNTFISRLEIDLSQAIKMKNSMSENWTTLVTSLIPHLLKSIETNIVGHDHLRFFEFNRIWHAQNKKFIEQKTLSGIIFDKKIVDFYSAKSELQNLFDMLKIEVIWQKPTKEVPVWFDTYQVAEIHTNGTRLGFAGIMSQRWMHKIVQGSAFIFELNGAILEEYTAAQVHFQPWSKFQEVSYDISLFVPMSITFDSLKLHVKKTNSLICNVRLLDFFEKEQMPNERAITLRYTISNHEKTMTKQELAEIIKNVEQAMVHHGAKIR